jgi:hypothetical protein
MMNASYHCGATQKVPSAALTDILHPFDWQVAASPILGPSQSCGMRITILFFRVSKFVHNSCYVRGVL